MNERDRKRFGTALAAVAATFGRELDQPAITGYWWGLGDLPIEAVENGLKRSLSACRFMPTCVEIRELAGELRSDQRAALAWEAFARAVVDLGYYKSVDFDDRAINATVRNLGGWTSLCERADDREEFQKWVRKDFERIYAAIVAAGVTPEQGKYLAGWHEQNNSFNGYADEIKPPVLVRTGLPPLLGQRRPRLLEESR